MRFLRAARARVELRQALHGGQVAAPASRRPRPCRLYRLPRTGDAGAAGRGTTADPLNGCRRIPRADFSDWQYMKLLYPPIFLGVYLFPHDVKYLGELRSCQVQLKTYKLRRHGIYLSMG